MPDTALLTRPPQSTEGEEILHLTCCDDDTALCGEDVSGQEWADKGNVCVPCEIEEMTGAPCQVAGGCRGTPAVLKGDGQ